MDVFNNRETALILWVVVFTLWALFKVDLKLKLVALFKSIFNKYIIIIFTITLLYIILSVTALYKMGLWTPSQLKNTLIWTLIVAFAAIFTAGKSDRPPSFSHEIKLNLRFLVFVEFLVNSYTLNLAVEILLLPITTLLALTVVRLGSDNGDNKAKRLAENLLTIIGILLVLWTCSQLYNNYAKVINLESLQNISTPTLLSACFFPFVYVLTFFFQYERFNLGLQYAIKDKKLRQYIKLRAMLKLHFNITSLNRWKNRLFSLEIVTKDTILNSINEMKKIIEKEKRNIYVGSASGWQPQEAKNYLVEKGLITGHYNSLDDIEWYAQSYLYEIGTSIIPNNVAYYVDGSSTTATKLRVVMNINSSDMIKESYSKFVECIEALLWHALKEPLPENLLKSLYGNENITLQLKNKNIKVIREDISNNINGSYRTEFSIGIPHQS